MLAVKTLWLKQNGTVVDISKEDPEINQKFNQDRAPFLKKCWYPQRKILTIFDNGDWWFKKGNIKDGMQFMEISGKQMQQIFKLVGI